MISPNNWNVQAAAPYLMQPPGFQQLTPTSAQGLTVPAGATLAIIRVDTSDATWRDDGTAPTSTVGIPLMPNDPPFVYAGDLAAIQFISATGHVNISYYR